jgi:hypothetical protein
MEGWIKIHRKILKWEWYTTPNMFFIFTHLLLTVNYEDSRYKGKVIKRGQRIFGYRKLSAETGISVQSVRTCIERLKSTHEITLESTHQYSIVTVCKYEEYQINEKDINTQSNTPTNMQATHDQHTTNTTLRNKEEKKGRIKKEDSISYFSEAEMENSKPEEGRAEPDPPEKVKEIEDFKKMLLENY